MERSAHRTASAAPHTLPGPAAVPVTGSFSAGGRIGTFSGSFRLESYGSEFELPTATGVFAGELRDADGVRIGMGSRRHTAAVEVVPVGAAVAVRLGPLDVNLMGLLVAVEELTLPETAGWAGPPRLRLVGSGRGRA